MPGAGKNNEEQIAAWNGAAGQSWVEAQDTLDRMFEPLEALLVEVAAAKPRAAVLDVGCGTGSTIIAVQRRLGAYCRCVGVDYSQPMFASARNPPCVMASTIPSTSSTSSSRDILAVELWIRRLGRGL